MFFTTIISFCLGFLWGGVSVVCAQNEVWCGEYEEDDPYYYASQQGKPSLERNYNE